MAKQKKKNHVRYNRSVMGRSDIPYAQRMAMKHRADIEYNREHSARIYMYCLCKALHDEEGIGYKRLVQFSLSFMELIKEFYEDPELAMAHIKQRLAQHGIEVSGEFFYIPLPGASVKEQEIYNNSLQATQAAQLVGAVTMNDVFGFGQLRQQRLREAVEKQTARYAKEGEGFLLEAMAEIGFKVEGNVVRAFLDENGNPMTAQRALKEKTYKGGSKNV